MLLLVIIGYYRLFHLKLFLFIINYFTLDYFWPILSNFNIWLLVVLLLVLLVVILLMDINSYHIGGYLWLFYWWLLVIILLMVIGEYSINGYCDYSIISHWWLSY